MPHDPHAEPQRDPWWTSAVVYQVYPRSFTDSNGDGIGDLRGITWRVGYLRELGVDALWLSPWYPSPMVDGGYDVSDYCDIHPDFGSLSDADELIETAHDAGLKVIIDLVANHASAAHPAFAAALAAEPGSPERALFHFRPGRGAAGALPPTNWGSFFGGPAWTRVTEADGSPGEWYLHMFDAQQPDWNWSDPAVAAFFDTVLQFWFDRGIDGFRIDVADSLAKDPAMPDVDVDPATGLGTVHQVPGHPWWDQPALADIQRRWRRIADRYDPPRMFVSEASAPGKLNYLAPDRLHATFIFDQMWAEWTPSSQRHMITNALAQHTAVGAPTTWVLGNHDAQRPVTRYGRPGTGWRFTAQGPEQCFDWGSGPFVGDSDLELGRRRARASALIEFALPGGAYVYQGEELGLDGVDELPPEARQDPAFVRTGGAVLGRDGCRVPLPWEGEEPPFGFSPGAGSRTWLPQPERWAELTAEKQEGDPDSTLNLYRRALRLRRRWDALGAGTLTWDDRFGPDTLAFTREPDFGCLVNFADAPVALPAGAEVLLSSARLDADRVPRDVAVWYRTPAEGTQP